MIAFALLLMFAVQDQLVWPDWLFAGALVFAPVAWSIA